MADVTLNGVAVNMEDPCALWQALYARKLRMLAGDTVEEIEIRSPVTTRRTVFTATNLAALDEQMNRLQAACEKKSGRRRLRYAQRGTHRPY
ncbi:MAG: hypothetical protein B7X99_10075 [Rhizobiales bacterium 17-65-6]|nr:MAG: hypothetical protein B7X99_10075 [Rhizobiales bacterium 17-65-6]